RAGRADAEGHGAVPDRVDVLLLLDGLRRDALAAVRPDDVVEDLADVLGLVDRVEDGVDRAGADLLPALDELDELLDDRAGLGDPALVALDGQSVAAEVELQVQAVAQRVEHAVADSAELGCHLVWDVQNFLHALSVGAPSGCRVLARSVD